MKKERPILFSTPMASALLSGSKTLTRRVVKDPMLYNTAAEFYDEEFLLLTMKKCPYGQIGDILYVKETFRELVDCQTGNFAEYDYKAGQEEFYKWAEAKNGYKVKWRPSLFMPKKAARIWLEITNIRVERLNDISTTDAINEGIESCGPPCGMGIDPFEGRWYKNYGEEGFSPMPPKECFRKLWESINGTGSWADNPWVWAIEFKRIERP